MSRQRRAAHVPMLLGALLASCIMPPDPHTRRVVPHLDLAAYGIHEECLHLTSGERLDYRFEASAAVHFSIQYREDRATLVPVERADTLGDAGIYPAPETRDYCLVWEAGAAGARLDYRFVAHAPATR